MEEKQSPEKNKILNLMFKDENVKKTILNAQYCFRSYDKKDTLKEKPILNFIYFPNKLEMNYKHLQFIISKKILLECESSLIFGINWIFLSYVENIDLRDFYHRFKYSFDNILLHELTFIKINYLYIWNFLH